MAQVNKAGRNDCDAVRALDDRHSQGRPFCSHFGRDRSAGHPGVRSPDSGSASQGILGTARIYFSEEGLHLQDSVSEARSRWEQFLGYLEDENAFLLYYNPKLYRIIPKRALAETGDAFSSIVHRKLTPYNYREPFAAIRSQTQSPPPSPSASSSLFS